MLKELREEAKKSSTWLMKFDRIVSGLADDAFSGYSARISGGEITEDVKQSEQLLTAVFDAFQHEVFELSPAFKEGLDALVKAHAYDLFKDSSPTFLSILVYRGRDSEGEEVAKEAWGSVLGRLADTNSEENDVLLRTLVGAADAGRLPIYLKVYGVGSTQGALDELVTERTMARSLGDAQLVQGLLVHHGMFHPFTGRKVLNLA